MIPELRCDDQKPEKVAPDHSQGSNRSLPFAQSFGSVDLVGMIQGHRFRFGNPFI